MEGDILLCVTGYDPDLHLAADSAAGFYMSDKPLVQQALATDLANILLSIPSLEASLVFLRGFWETMIREWAGLDKLRFVRNAPKLPSLC